MRAGGLRWFPAPQCKEGLDVGVLEIDALRANHVRSTPNVP